MVSRELSESAVHGRAQGVEGPATTGLTGDYGARMRQPTLLGCARGGGRKHGVQARILRGLAAQEPDSCSNRR